MGNWARQCLEQGTVAFHPVVEEEPLTGDSLMKVLDAIDNCTRLPLQNRWPCQAARYSPNEGGGDLLVEAYEKLGLVRTSRIPWIKFANQSYVRVLQEVDLEEMARLIEENKDE